jgi:hypothetical protein
MVGAPRPVLDIRETSVIWARKQRSSTLCSHCSESINQLLLGCIFSQDVLFKTLRHYGWHLHTPSPDSSFVYWWLRSCKRIWRKALDSVVVLVWHDTSGYKLNGGVFRKAGFEERVTSQGDHPGTQIQGPPSPLYTAC